MNKFLTLLIFLFLNASIVAQDFKFPTKADFPNLPKYGKSIDVFVPKDWEIIGKAFGDLNADKIEDCVLVIKANYDKFINKNDGLGSDPFDTNPRVLVILFKDKNGYRIVKQNNTFIFPPSIPTMDDPFQQVAIRKGILQLNFYLWYSAGSWSTSGISYKFRLQKGEFVLIGADKTESMRNSGEIVSTSYNFLTNKMKIITGNFSSDENEKTWWKTIRINRLKTLDSFEKPFTWKIGKGNYI